MSEKQWNVSVDLVRSSEKNARNLSTEEQRELIRSLARLDPRPADCEFSSERSTHPVNPPVTVYFSAAGATNQFEAQNIADGLMKKLEEILPSLDLRILQFSVSEIKSS